MFVGLIQESLHLSMEVADDCPKNITPNTM